MEDKFSDLRINAERFQQDFEAISHIGSSGDGGVDRPAFSDAHLAARTWFRQRIEDAGLTFRLDGAGNHSGFLKCSAENAPTLLLGSHLDSVPKGGRFDGALGVLAALEVLRVIHEAGLHLPTNLEAIDFSDEEGRLVGLMGSNAVAGSLSEKDLAKPAGGRSALLDGLLRAGLNEAGILSAKRDPSTLAGFLELHIEQGPRLEQESLDIGVVTTMTGICLYNLKFTGRADHSGTTPMHQRLDASLGASNFVLSASTMVTEKFLNCTVNVGSIELMPGASNIVPQCASLILELRAPELDTLNRLESTLLELANHKAGYHKLKLEAEFIEKHPPNTMDIGVQGVIRNAASSLGLSHINLYSGAFHDAEVIARICPAGMIFVPSQGGASHSPREFTPWKDCMNGANVLLNATLRLATSQIN